MKEAKPLDDVQVEVYVCASGSVCMNILVDAENRERKMPLS